jgi:hypothetical protein
MPAAAGGGEARDLLKSSVTMAERLNSVPDLPLN